MYVLVYFLQHFPHRSHHKFLALIIHLQEISVTVDREAYKYGLLDQVGLHLHVFKFVHLHLCTPNVQRVRLVCVLLFRLGQQLESSVKATFKQTCTSCLSFTVRPNLTSCAISLRKVPARGLSITPLPDRSVYYVTIITACDVTIFTFVLWFQLRPVDGASVFVRVADGRRDEELPPVTRARQMVNFPHRFLTLSPPPPPLPCLFNTPELA